MSETDKVYASGTHSVETSVVNVRKCSNRDPGIQFVDLWSRDWRIRFVDFWSKGLKILELSPLEFILSTLEPMPENTEKFVNAFQKASITDDLDYLLRQTSGYQYYT